MKIIVTGSTGLIGSTLVPCLREKGHEVVECSRSLGHDLTDEAFVQEFFEENRADALVNLFGLDDKLQNEEMKPDTVWEFSLELFEEYMKVNVTSLFSVCREFALNNQDSSIVNFSSIYGVVSPNPVIYGYSKHKHVGYCVSKGAVLSLSKYLAVHLSDCRVNSVICGAVENNQGGNFPGRFCRRTPMGRMAEPEELVGLVEFLCSSASSYCTGGEFTIDGGYTAL